MLKAAVMGKKKKKDRRKFIQSQAIMTTKRNQCSAKTTRLAFNCGEYLPAVIQ